jgi:predicted regulator of Ras-like GTPase activity (Roadblock/LC7/MglB family)
MGNNGVKIMFLRINNTVLNAHEIKAMYQGMNSGVKAAFVVFKDGTLVTVDNVNDERFNAASAFLLALS